MTLFRGPFPDALNNLAPAPARDCSGRMQRLQNMGTTCAGRLHPVFDRQKKKKGKPKKQNKLRNFASSSVRRALEAPKLLSSRLMAVSLLFAFNAVAI